MRRREFLATTVASTVGVGVSPAVTGGVAATSTDGFTQGRASSTRKILIAGGGFNTGVHPLHGRSSPASRGRSCCYLPTASADSPQRHHHLVRNCAPLDVEASHQDSFIASTRQARSWEEVFLSVDGIVCSGGNTLNQQAIWKAQGIDAILRQAWDRGIVLGGASAGSLCWFEEGTTDSRPKELSIVQCLGLPEGQPLAALRRRARTPAALSEADRLGADEAGLRVRQRRRHLLRGQRGQARGSHARRREGVLRERRGREGRREGDGARAAGLKNVAARRTRAVRRAAGRAPDQRQKVLACRTEVA